ncbi:hypothetical protein F4X10_16345 [Candidatus Poribacteria bacterium]|nr:hypothetical protein [Candidatus Poribacteria bacterium]
MNDIQILQEMLAPAAQVILQPGPGRPSAQLTDLQSGTTVEIKGLPHNSIVIRAEDFENPLTIFNGSKGERKRADFVIVSNDESDRKWVICVETQGGNKAKGEVTAQLKGAACFIGYCKCIGKSFWRSHGFLDGYQYRFVSIAGLNMKKIGIKPIQSEKGPHDHPENFRRILRHPIIHFHRLIHPIS